MARVLRVAEHPGALVHFATESSIQSMDYNPNAHERDSGLAGANATLRHWDPTNAIPQWNLPMAGPMSNRYSILEDGDNLPSPTGPGASAV